VGWLIFDIFVDDGEVVFCEMECEVCVELFVLFLGVVVFGGGLVFDFCIEVDFEGLVVVFFDVVIVDVVKCIGFV